MFCRPPTIVLFLYLNLVSASRRVAIFHSEIWKIKLFLFSKWKIMFENVVFGHEYKLKLFLTFWWVWKKVNMPFLLFLKFFSRVQNFQISFSKRKKLFFLNFTMKHGQTPIIWHGANNRRKAREIQIRKE